MHIVADLSSRYISVPSLVPRPTPSFSLLLSDEKLGVGLGTRLKRAHFFFYSDENFNA